MKIKDIVNRDIVNLTNCEHEPIHIPGSIQPHGFLVALIKSTRRIDFCSANIFEFTGIRHEQVLTRTMAEVVGDQAGKAIENYIGNNKESFAAPLMISVNGNIFNMSANYSKDHLVLEFEPYEAPSTNLDDFYSQTRDFVGYMEKSTTLQELCQRVAEQTRSITGYDRVMVYRFDKEYNGEVFAEAKREDLEPFLGLHYPHTDIPVQARELYKKNLLRLIVDVKYTPTPIFTVDDAPNKNLDLGNCVLRSISPIHIQYLSNIGVSATLTVSLMHEENLWGLIACHHYSSAKYLNNFVRNASRIQGHFITSQINVRQIAERSVNSQKINAALEKMLSLALTPDRTMFARMVEQKELLQLCNASGVAIFIEEDVFTGGDVPEKEELVKLLTELKMRMPLGTLCFDRLLDIYPDAERLRHVAAGVLYHRFDAGRNVGITWFRHETIEEVNWAGDPSKAIVKDEKGLHPRNSFGLWKEIVKFKSMPWAEEELTAASSFGHNVERQAHLLFISEEEHKYRQLSEVLKKTNLELENINWIGTHDLKEPLRKIKLFASRILSLYGEELNENVVDSINKMNNSALRMQTLITDLLEYSKVRNNKEAFVDVDINDVFRELRELLQSEGTDTQIDLSVSGMPTVKGVRFLLLQLFVNLIRNSIKFARQGTPLKVDVTCSVKTTQIDGSNGTFYEISVRDNGIGFERQYNELIFNVFTRLHTQTEYSGTGVGLALCRKIMTLHNGMIKAHGKLGEGAEFTLYFPVV